MIQIICTPLCICQINSLLHTAVHHILAEMAKKKNPAAVALGRKGGRNSRANLPPEERTALAKKAAMARWKAVKKKPAAPKGE
jgi:hypothetical protein